MKGTTFLLLYFLSRFDLTGADRSRHPGNVNHTTPSTPHDMTSGTIDLPANPPRPSLGGKRKSAAAAATTHSNHQLLSTATSLLQSLSSAALRTKPPDLSKETMLHVHLHEGQVFRTNASLREVAFGESGYFIKKLFQKYGTSGMELTFKGLRDLMTHIGLDVHEEDVKRMANHAGHTGGEEEEEEEEGEMNGETVQRKRRSNGLVKSMASRVGQNVKRDLKKRSAVNPLVISHSHGDHSECHALSHLLSAFHFDLLTELDPGQFLLLCPALIDQLDNSGCHRHGNQHHHHYHDHDHGNQQNGSDDQERDHSHPHSEESDTDRDPAMTSQESGDSKGSPATVWLYSCAAVGAISGVGLLGVAVIPIIRGRLYKVLQQFLIALAVGALSGDALLHLLPHALSPAHPKGESKNRDGHLNTTASSHQHEEGEEDDDHSAVVWKGLAALLGLLFFFLAERLLVILTARRTRRREKSKARKKSKLLEMSSDGVDQVTIVPPPSDTDVTYIRETAILADNSQLEQQGDDATRSFLGDTNHNHDHDHDNGNLHPQSPAQYQGHGHGHSHGEVPRSMSAVVVMVIFGDGIHNFSDGLAIGAAFANSVTGGFSTAVAVLCHELPHEIGDFAMLLSAGMTWQRAMLYNVLSSVLCLLGSVVGVFLGNLENAVLWIFPAVAGMFLYISLADMLPELALTKEKMVGQVLIQCAGIAIGSGIMLIIAIFEHDLKSMLD